VSSSDVTAAFSPRLERRSALGGFGQDFGWGEERRGGKECDHWSRGKGGGGQSQGFIQKGQRSGVYTERVGVFTADS